MYTSEVEVSLSCHKVFFVFRHHAPGFPVGYELRNSGPGNPYNRGGKEGQCPQKCVRYVIGKQFFLGSGQLLLNDRWAQPSQTASAATQCYSRVAETVVCSSIPFLLIQIPRFLVELLFFY